MGWFTLAIVSAVSLAIATILQRVLLKEKESEPVAYAILFQLLAGAILFIFALTQGLNFAGFDKVMPNIVLATILYASAVILLFKAFKLSEASSVSVINSSRAVWNALGAWIFLREVVTLTILLGTLLVISGVALVFYRKSAWSASRGHTYALLSAALFGLAFVNDAFIFRTLDVPTYTFLAFLLPGLVMIAYSPKSLEHLRLFFRTDRLTKMVVFTSFYSAAALMVYSALKLGGPASQVYPVHQLNIILTVILAAILLQEKTQLLLKIIGAILAFSGIVLLR